MIHLTPEEITQLNDAAYEIRKKSIEMVVAAKWGHLGGAFSLAEVFAVLYHKVLDITPENVTSTTRDQMVLSKAHSSPVMYTAMAQKGLIKEEDLFTYCRIGGLEGHLDALDNPAVDMTAGSLGLGMSYSAGLALGLRQQGAFMSRVYCVCGDGELSEGQMWEGIMFAGHMHLDNLILIVDYNKVMAKGFIYQEMTQEPLADRFKAFGWNVLEVDGHDVEDIYLALYKAKHMMVVGKPIAVIAHTVKGKGIRECEFNYKWHTHAPSAEKGNEFLRELAQRYGKEYQPFTPYTPTNNFTTMADIMKEADAR